MKLQQQLCDRPLSRYSGLRLGRVVCAALVAWALTFSATAQVEEVQLIGHLGGSCYAVHVQETFVYMGEGPELTILDITVTTEPVRMGSLLLPDTVRGVVVSGNYAYVAAWGAGLQVVNVENILEPYVVTSYPTAPYKAAAVSLLDNRLYVAEGTYDSSTGGFPPLGPGRVEILDVNLPFEPQSLGAYSITGNAGDVIASQTLAGTTMFVADDKGYVRIVNVSNAANPVVLASYLTAGMACALDLCPYQSSLLVACRRPSPYTAAGFDIINVSDPSNPAATATYRTPDPMGGEGLGVAVDVSRKTAYFAANSQGQLEIVNIAPASPLRWATYSTPGKAHAVCFSGTVVLVGDADAGGLYIVDVSDRLSPELLSKHETPGFARNVFVSQENKLYVVDRSGLRIMDPSTTEPVLLDSYSQAVGDATRDEARDVFVSGIVAYLVYGGSGATAGLRILDASSTPATEIGSYSGTTNAKAVYVSGNLAYVTDRNGLHVVDVTDPGDPASLAFVATATGGGEGIGAWDTTAYLPYGSNQLRIYDMSDPTLPVLLSTYSTPGYDLQDMQVEGDWQGPRLLYGAFGEGSYPMKILHVGDPRAPWPYGTAGSPGFATGIGVYGRYAFLACGKTRGTGTPAWDGGVKVFDVTDTFDPNQIAHFNIPCEAPKICAVDKYAYLAAEEKGVYIFRHPGATAMRAAVRMRWQLYR